MFFWRPQDSPEVTGRGCRALKLFASASTEGPAFLTIQHGNGICTPWHGVERNTSAETRARGCFPLIECCLRAFAGAFAARRTGYFSKRALGPAHTLFVTARPGAQAKYSYPTGECLRLRQVVGFTLIGNSQVLNTQQYSVLSILFF